MARREAKRTILDDYGEAHDYFAIQLPAGKGWRLLVRLVGLAAGAAGRSVGALTPANLPQVVQKELSGLLDAGIDGEGLGAAFERLAGQLLEDEQIVRTLLDGLNRDGNPLSNQLAFDEAFAGNYGEMVLAIAFAAEHNFAPFFKRTVGMFRGLGGKLKGVMSSVNLPAPA